MKINRLNNLKDILIFVFINISIFLVITLASYSYSVKSERQDSFPGIDDDGSWTVQKIEHGYPLKLVTIYETNGGFWTGYSINSNNKYHAFNILLYFGASFIVTLGLYPFVNKKH